MHHKNIHHCFLFFCITIMPWFSLAMHVTTVPYKNRRYSYTHYMRYWSGLKLHYRSQNPLLITCDHNNNTLLMCYTSDRPLRLWTEEYNMLTEINLINNTETKFEPLDALNKKDVKVTLLSQLNDKYIIGHGSTLIICNKLITFFSHTLIPQKSLSLQLQHRDNFEKSFSHKNDLIIATNTGDFFKIENSCITENKDTSSLTIKPFYSCTEEIYAIAFDQDKGHIACGLRGEIHIINVQDGTVLHTIKPTMLQTYEINVLDIKNNILAYATNNRFDPTPECTGKAENTEFSGTLKKALQLYSELKVQENQEKKTSTQQQLLAFWKKLSTFYTYDINKKSETEKFFNKNTVIKQMQLQNETIIIRATTNADAYYYPRSEIIRSYDLSTGIANKEFTLSGDIADCFIAALHNGFLIAPITDDHSTTTHSWKTSGFVGDIYLIGTSNEPQNDISKVEKIKSYFFYHASRSKLIFYRIFNAYTIGLAIAIISYQKLSK